MENHFANKRPRITATTLNMNDRHILHHQQQQQATGILNNNAANITNGATNDTWKQDFYNVLKPIVRSGSFSTGGICPDSFLYLPRLKFRDLYEVIALPIGKYGAELFKSKSITVIDRTVHDAWEVDNTHIEVNCPKWQSQIEIVAKQTVEALGISTDTNNAATNGANISNTTCKNLGVDLSKVVLYECGGQYSYNQQQDINIINRKNSNTNPFGTLIIQLPSNYTGGTFSTSFKGIKVNYDLGANDGSCNDRCHYLAHYGDVQHHISGITSGYSLVMVYSLYWKTTTAAPSNRRIMNFSSNHNIHLNFEDQQMKSAEEASHSAVKVKELLTRWKKTCVAGYLLRHEYVEPTILEKGFQCLQGCDNAIVKAFEIANIWLQQEQQQQQNCAKLLLLQISKHCIYDNKMNFLRSDETFDSVYDSNGKKLKFTGADINFCRDSIANLRDFNLDNNDNWGNIVKKEVVETNTNGDDPSQMMTTTTTTTTNTYHRYALLIFPMWMEFEFELLSKGIEGGVNALIAQFSTVTNNNNNNNNNGIQPRQILLTTQDQILLFERKYAEILKYVLTHNQTNLQPILDLLILMKYKAGLKPLLALIDVMNQKRLNNNTRKASDSLDYIKLIQNFGWEDTKNEWFPAICSSIKFFKTVSWLVEHQFITLDNATWLNLWNNFCSHFTATAGAEQEQNGGGELSTPDEDKILSFVDMWSFLEMHRKENYLNEYYNVLKQQTLKVQCQITLKIMEESVNGPYVPRLLVRRLNYVDWRYTTNNVETKHKCKELIAMWMYLQKRNTDDSKQLLTCMIQLILHLAPKTNIIQELQQRNPSRIIDQSQPIYNLFLQRAALIESISKPIFSWQMPEASMPNHPEVENFLRGPTEAMIYFNFESIAHVQNWIKKHFNGTNLTFTAKAVEGGNGTSAFARVTKTRQWFDLLMDKYKKTQDEYISLMLQIGRFTQQDAATAAAANRVQNNINNINLGGARPDHIRS